MVACVALVVFLAGGLAQAAGLLIAQVASYGAALTAHNVPPILMFVLCYILHSLVGGGQRLTRT